MVSMYQKIIVAENCDEYQSRNYVLNSQISYISHGCSDCINYVNNKCTRELFEEIEERIKKN